MYAGHQGPSLHEYNMAEQVCNKLSDYTQQVQQACCTSGLALDKARSRVLLPTLGRPTKPMSARLFISRISTARSPG